MTSLSYNARTFPNDHTNSSMRLLLCGAQAFDTERASDWLKSDMNCSSAHAAAVVVQLFSRLEKKRGFNIDHIPIFDLNQDSGAASPTQSATTPKQEAPTPKRAAATPKQAATTSPQTKTVTSIPGWALVGTLAVVVYVLLWMLGLTS